MTSSQPLTDQRGAAFSRLASRVLEALNEAVEHRREEGQSITELADKLGCHRSVMSRVLNGTSANLTLRTISDILWATNYEPQDFKADPIESLCGNMVSFSDEIADIHVDVVKYPTRNVIMSSPEISEMWGASVYQKPQLESRLR
jgi:transcriptional regulator with XRE-family HTH domain